MVACCWLTLWALLVAAVTAGAAAALTVAPTCRVKGLPEAELRFQCGDGEEAGVVQYWNTPFGDLQTPGVVRDRDPVFMHHDGSLVLPTTSVLHSGLYYCLLQDTEGSTLWSYELHVGPSQREHSSCGAFRVRRAERQQQVRVGDQDQDHTLASAVAASVLLTFVVGFSVGALSRTRVLRCVGVVTERLRSPWRRQGDRPDHGPEVAMETMYNNQAFEEEQVTFEDSVVTEMTLSSMTPSPPAKPKRSFRQKRREEQEEEVERTTAYLEGCDHVEEDGEKMEEEAGRRKEEKQDGEEEEEEEAGRMRKEEKQAEEGSESREEEEVQEVEAGWRREEKQDGEEEEAGWRRKEKQDGEEEVEAEDQKEEYEEEEEEEEESSAFYLVGGEGVGRVEDKCCEDKKEEEEVQEMGEEQRRSKEEEEKEEEEGETICTDSCQSEPEGGAEDPEDPPASPCSSGRRSRVIRLYQYDEDGHRYCHLPDPSPDDPGPAPRLKQRSLSLTRLNAIMAAASTSPLDRTETGREEKTQFHMEI